jgi:hypothetical protein
MRRVALGCSVLLVLGCASGIAREDLPSDPIAFVRQEPKSGIASLEEFMEAVQVRRLGEDEAPSPPSRTTLALLTPSSGEIRAVPGATPGAIPLDWSSDGLRLLIGRSGRRRGVLQLFAWNRLTGAFDRVTPDRSEGSAAFGAGPIRLAHVGRFERPGLPVQRGVVLYTQRGPRVAPEGVDGEDPDVAPDGGSVVFVRPHPRPHQEPLIVRADLEDKQSRPLGRGMHPRFSRDGRWIVYVSRRRGNADVWMMRADGTSKRSVTASGYDEDFPAVSPDGRFVVYSSVRGGQTESHLFLTRLQDGVEIQLTQNAQSGRPVW